MKVPIVPGLSGAGDAGSPPGAARGDLIFTDNPVVSGKNER
jgi:hypothetical protein